MSCRYADREIPVAATGDHTATTPWQLLVASVLSGTGWGAMSAVAVNVIVSPWFVRSRPAALGMAYNGWSIGGVIFSPLWVAAIGALGFSNAAAAIGLVMALKMWVLADSLLTRTPQQMGLAPDGDVLGTQPTSVTSPSAKPLHQDGSFLINRLGAEGVIDRDLVVVLLDLRRRLKDEYGDTPAVMMQIDWAVVAYRDFLRITGWVGNLAIHIEHEFFGRDGPSAHFRNRYGQESRVISGLTAEQHLAHLREGLLPLAERCGRAMREALAALEMLRATRSPANERSRPIRIAIVFEPHGLN
jgi:hypothetical protein